MLAWYFTYILIISVHVRFKKEKWRYLFFYCSLLRLHPRVYLQKICQSHELSAMPYLQELPLWAHLFFYYCVCWDWDLWYEQRKLFITCSQRFVFPLFCPENFPTPIWSGPFSQVNTICEPCEAIQIVIYAKNYEKMCLLFLNLSRVEQALSFLNKIRLTDFKRVFLSLSVFNDFNGWILEEYLASMIHLISWCEVFS